MKTESTGDTPTPPSATPGVTAFIAVVGPPASGRTPIARALAHSLGGTVYRPTTALTVRPSSTRADFDPLDWLTEPAADTAVSSPDVPLPGFPRNGPVIWENTPTTTDELWFLDIHADLLHIPLALVEIGATGSRIHARAVNRRACLVCYPHPDDDPIDPRLTDPTVGNDCPTCETPLMPLFTRDSAPAFAEQVLRYQHSMPAVRTTARALSIPYIVAALNDNITWYANSVADLLRRLPAIAAATSHPDQR